MLMGIHLFPPFLQDYAVSLVIFWASIKKNHKSQKFHTAPRTLLGISGNSQLIEILSINEN